MVARYPVLAASLALVGCAAERGRTTTPAADPAAKRARSLEAHPPPLARRSDGHTLKNAARTGTPLGAPARSIAAPREHDEPEHEAAPTLDPFLTHETPPRCPKEMALVLDESCIDRWEAALLHVLPGGVEKPWSPYRSLTGFKGKLRAISTPGVAPQGYISGEQAERACRNSGKRLCTPREWETACRGPARTTYPYGDTRRRKVCNDDGRALHPVHDLTARLGLAEDRMWYESMGHPMINQLPNTLRKTGEREDCTNGYGVYDMVGNLHEWVEDAAGTFRGGFYMDTRINGEGCKYATTAHNLKYHDYSTGFRCCMDAFTIE